MWAMKIGSKFKKILFLLFQMKQEINPIYDGWSLKFKCICMYIVYQHFDVLEWQDPDQEDRYFKTNSIDPTPDFWENNFNLETVFRMRIRFISSSRIRYMKRIRVTKSWKICIKIKQNQMNITFFFFLKIRIRPYPYQNKTDPKQCF